jgi:hypothetical protein
MSMQMVLLTVNKVHHTVQGRDEVFSKHPPSILLWRNRQTSDLKHQSDLPSVFARFFVVRK